MALRDPDGEIVEIELHMHTQTDKAWKLSDDGEPKNAKWAPKAEVQRGDKVSTGAYKFTLPEWLAIDRGWV